MEKQEKPSIDTILSYLKSNIPNCQINDKEVTDFKTLYEKSSFQDLNRVFHQALKMHAMQPISYMNQQLRVIRPPLDPFNRQIQKQSFGKNVEEGVDWTSKTQNELEETERFKANYDQEKGIGAYERDLKEFDDRLLEFFKNTTKSQNTAFETNYQKMMVLAKELKII